MRISKKPWPRYSSTNLHGSRCSPRASSGGTTRAAARPGRLPRRRGPLARNQARPPRPDRCKLLLLRACKPRPRLTSRTRRGRRPPRAARQDQPARHHLSSNVQHQTDRIPPLVESQMVKMALPPISPCHWQDRIHGMKRRLPQFQRLAVCHNAVRCCHSGWYYNNPRIIV